MLDPHAVSALAAGLFARHNGISAVLTYAARRHPHTVAMIDDREMISCAQLSHRVAATVDALSDLELTRGERTGVPVTNDIDSVVALLAAARLGMSVWPVDARQPPEAMARLAADHHWSLVLTPARTPTMGETLRHTPLVQVSRHGPAPDRPDPRALVVLTGGTTGVPKAAGRRAGPSSMWVPFRALLADVGLTAGGTSYVTTPLHHGFGLSALLLGLVLGTTIHLTGRFDPATVADRLRLAGPDVLVAVPTTLRRLLTHDPGAFGEVRTIVSGSAPLPPEVTVGIREVAAARLFHLFGTSEVGFCALATPAMLRDDPGTIGRPIPGTRMRVVDGGGLETPPGAVGSLEVRSPAATRRGWIATGDLGHQDTHGLLHLDGRSDDLVQSGGVSVAPAALERALQAHPRVDECAVVAVRDADLGRRLAAFVVTTHGNQITSDELCRWLEDQVAHPLRPRWIRCVPELPLTPALKIDHQALSRLAQQGD